MMIRLRESVVSAKRRLADSHARLRARHEEGGTGVEVSRAITELRDEVVLELSQAALADLTGGDSAALSARFALVAHGGYGRADMAPYSDIDLMILSAAGSAAEIAPLAERLLRDVFDAGLVLGHSVRTPEEACRLSAQDPLICTSLVESRFLWGNRELFDSFASRFERRLRSRPASLVAAIDRARNEERIKYGETVYLLEPNVKRSRGSLRDIQLLRWIGRVRHGNADLNALAAAGQLPEEDARAVARALEFLLRLRNEMHFHAGRSSDVLARSEQLRIAERFGYRPAAGMLPVESFMRDYFRHTEQVSNVVRRFVTKARASRRGQVMMTLLGHWVPGGFRVGPSHIGAAAEGLELIRSGLDGIMQLVELASLYDKEITPETWQVVRETAAGLSGVPSPDSIRMFRSVLGRPTRLGELLRGLHEIGLLERFIPGFSHARGLLQFNQYHKFTVDEHSLRAVEQAADLQSAAGPLAAIYRAIGRKDVLHLALLTHDLGKGYPEDHCEAGRRIATETAARLGLEAGARDALAFLVHRHLLMNHLAFRRDTSDEELILRFAVEVGSPELLEMLTVLTAADMAAVAPDAWTNWKADIVIDLFDRAMQYLAGETLALDLEQHLDERRRQVGEQLGLQQADTWFARQLDGLPPAYLHGTRAEQIVADLRLLNGLPEKEVKVRSEFDGATGTLQVLVATTENITPGVFHRLTGALTSQGLEILSAEINTLADGLVLDRFRVVDPDHAGIPPPERLKRIEGALEQSLRQPATQPPVFRQTWRIGGTARPTLRNAHTRIEIDNHASAICTVCDIFAADRPGLLYAIARTLFEMELSVWRAKIGTFLDQVVDVFYVTDAAGAKIEDEARLEAIRRRLLGVIESLEAQSASPSG